MVVNLLLSASATPERVEQGQLVRIGISYRNIGDDTGWDASALAQLPPGFQVISPGSTLLGNIGPNSIGGTVFTLAVPENCQEGVHLLRLMISCQERHAWGGNKSYLFPADVRIIVVEDEKKRAARLSLSEAKLLMEKLVNGIFALEKAGGNADDVKRSQAELSKQIQEIEGFMSSKDYPRVMIHAEKIISEVNGLIQANDLAVQALQVEAEQELRDVEEDISHCDWVKDNKLKQTRDTLKVAKSLFAEGKYAESKKAALLALSSFPSKPWRRRILEAWEWLKP